MPKTGITTGLRKAILRGKTRGDLTYREFREAERREDTEVNGLDHLGSMLGGLPIESTHEEEASALPSDHGDGIGQTVGLAEPKQENVVPGDPLKMYLRDVGSISLFTLEEEVETASQNSWA